MAQAIFWEFLASRAMRVARKNFISDCIEIRIINLSLELYGTKIGHGRKWIDWNKHDKKLVDQFFSFFGPNNTNWTFDENIVINRSSCNDLYIFHEGDFRWTISKLNCILQFVCNKTKGRISKWVFQEKKASPISRKTNISLKCSFFGKFSFVFLKHPFWDSHFCLITDELLSFKFKCPTKRMNVVILVFFLSYYPTCPTCLQMLFMAIKDQIFSAWIGKCGCSCMREHSMYFPISCNSFIFYALGTVFTVKLIKCYVQCVFTILFFKSKREYFRS